MPSSGVAVVKQAQPRPWSEQLGQEIGQGGTIQRISDMVDWQDRTPFASFAVLLPFPFGCRPSLFDVEAHMQDTLSFGRWLQQRRQALDLTQAEFAERVGVAPNTIHKIEADARRPSKEVAHRMAEVLDIAPAERALFVRVARAELAVDRLRDTQVTPHTVLPIQALLGVQHVVLPTGTMTFLLTDIEGSTALWEQHSGAMRAALERYDSLVVEITRQCGGVLIRARGEDDSCCIVFGRGSDAVTAAVTLQQSFAAETWPTPRPLRVRMALHTGEAQLRDGSYYGDAINRCARLRAVSHGEQILISAVTWAVVRGQLAPEFVIHDLGEHYLRDLIQPEHIYQVTAPGMRVDFPPLDTAAEVHEDRLTPRRIRGYELREQLGAGSSGLVFRAFQSLVHRDVAIKIILPAYANHPAFIRSFEHEAQIIARLEHPHIVPLYDYWRDPGGAYLVMRWMQGGSLQSKLQQGALNLPTVLSIFEEIVPALEVAHRQRVVHRDLKPANILLDAEGHAYLTDFGIALEMGIGDTDDVPNEPMLGGTLAYSAPEQIRNEPVTARTDVYGLGILLYELLIGTHPFGSTTPAEMRARQLQESLPSLSARRPDLPSRLDMVISRATAKDPEARYPSALELLADIEMANAESSGVAPHRMVDAASEVTTDLPILAVNPYKGLRAFQKADAEDFFGRTALCQELLGHLSAKTPTARFLAVVGPSGSGKSSVVLAGLIPALHSGAVPGSEAWFIVEMMPGAYPLDELEATLLRVAVNPPTTLLEQLQQDERGLGRAIKRVLPADEKIELVLVIDQFEELFTLVQDDAVRTHFLHSLHAAVVDPRSRVRVIITLRADFYDRPLLYGEFGELVRQHTAVVLPLTGEELSEAVVGPARNVGVKVEQQLVSAIISDVNSQPGTLPLLQYALTELFENRVGQQLTLATYRSSGGIQGALGRRADALYDSLDPVGQNAARQVFLRLVRLGEGVEDTRRRVRRSKLRALGHERDAVDMVIDRYVRYRLLTLDRDPVTREPTVELAHEALLRTWARLREWLKTSRDDLRVQQRLMVAVDDWLAVDEDADFLATGARLAQFELLADGELALSNDEQRYITASVAARDAGLQREAARRAQEARLERRSRSVLRALVMVLLISTLGALGLSGIAWVQRQEALRQEQEAQRQRQAAQAAEAQVKQQLVVADAQRLALAAQSQIANAPETALLLAYEAVMRDRNPVTEQAVRDALDHVSWRPTSLRGHTDRVIRARFTPDGQHILTASADKTGRMWDLSGKQLVVFAGHTDVVNRAITSPDGQRVLTTSLDKTGRLWDLNGEQLALLKGHTDGVNEAVFSADGQMILTASLDGTSRLWDLSGKQLVALEGHEDEVTSAMFSPDGKTILTSSADTTARLWDLSGKQLVVFGGHTGSVLYATFSPDGRQVATSSGDSTAQLWDLTGAPLATFRGHTNGVSTVVFSPDGRMVLTASQDKTVRLWDLSGQELAVMHGHTDAVPGAEFSPDGLSILSKSVDQTARLWDLSGQELAVLSHAGRVIDAVFSTDGQRLLTASVEQTARIWSLAGPPVATLGTPGEGVNRALFSPDGQAIVTASADNTARLWDLSGEPLAVLKGHSDAVIRAAFSSDGQHILTGAEDATARLWNRSGRSMTVLEGHADDVTSVGFDPDGRLLLTASADRTIRLWDQSGTQLAIFSGHGAEVRNAIFSPDGRTILSASQDKTARLWDLSGQELVVLQGHTDEVLNARFSPDGHVILTCSKDGTARLWDLHGKQLVVFEGHAEAVNTARFSPDGQSILTSSDDRTVRLWDLHGKQLVVFEGHKEIVTGAEFSPDGQWIVSKSLDQTARVWDLSGKQRAILSHADRVIHAEFSPDGKRILTGSRDGTARQWSLDGKQILILSHTSREDFPFTGRRVPDNVVHRALFSPTGQQILTTSQDGTARLWDLHGVPAAVLRGHSAGVVAADFSSDGQWIATGSTDKTARLWDVSGKQLAILKGHTGRLFTVKFSPDGQYVLTSSQDKTARLWDLSGKELAIFEGHEDEVRSAVFDPDGQKVLSVSLDMSARLWNLSGRQLAVLAGHTDAVTSAVFSPDGKTILTASRDTTVRLWTIDGKQIGIFAGHTDYVVSAIFSPDAQKILTASRDTTARLWDLSGKQLAIMSHSGQINSITFATDGQHIATAGTDATVRLWDLSGHELVIFKGHSDLVTGAEFSPDGRRIVTSSRDGTARQFLVVIDDVLKVAGCRVSRGLNNDEITRFSIGKPTFNYEERRCTAGQSL
jgi:WD40 repeat protein/class 3 adenylate cyclase/energy-coupling factor transporter ATP-binding protein EcfA2